MARRTETARRLTGGLLLAGVLLAAAAATPAATLTVCMAADNPPLSWLAGGTVRGLDQRIALAAAEAMGRTLVVVPFESEYEKESTLAQEVNALLSSGVCDAVSGYPLVADDLGPPSRPTAQTPDYPGAKRKRQRPFVALNPVAGSRAYQAVTLGLVQRTGSAPMKGLGDLGERHIGATIGTLGGAVAMIWHNGALRQRLVTVAQNESLLDALASPTARFEVALLPLALFDGWRLQHPDGGLSASPWRRPIGINLGFVTLASANEVRAAFDGTISGALADGRLARWATDEGVSWTPPSTPEVSRGYGLASLTGD